MARQKKRARTRITLLAVSIEGTGPTLGAALTSVVQQMRGFISAAAKPKVPATGKKTATPPARADGVAPVSRRGRRAASE